MRFSAPPMIILLDVLFVFIFLLTFEQSPNIKIVLPNNVWLGDFIVVSEDKSKRNQHWFNVEINSWESFSSFPKEKNRKFSFIIGRIPCEKSHFCMDIPSLDNETKKIYIKGNLYDQLSGLISDSCLAFPRECASVSYHIKDDGTVDTRRLKENYTVFGFILKDK